MKRLVKSSWLNKRLSVHAWDFKLERDIVNPAEIEQEISHEMRYKEWHLGPKRSDPTTIVFTWITQDPFDDEDEEYRFFWYEARRVAENVFKIYEDAVKLEVAIYVRDDRSNPQNWNTFEFNRGGEEFNY